MIPITVRGVPILASVSNASVYTMVSSAFVKTFGLGKTNLTSTAFTSANPARASGPGLAGTVLKDLVFTLGDAAGIPIRLNTAIEASTLDGGRIGVQLGLDFFMRAAWYHCRVLANC